MSNCRILQFLQLLSIKNMVWSDGEDINTVKLVAEKLATTIHQLFYKTFKKWIRYPQPLMKNWDDDEFISIIMNK